MVPPGRVGLAERHDSAGNRPVAAADGVHRPTHARLDAGRAGQRLRPHRPGQGLSRSKVIWKHCLRNAFLPVLSFLGPASAATLTGSFVVEKVFNVPGLGQHFVNSVINRDQTLILGTVMVYSAFVLALNLMVDIGYAVVDPRIDVTK